MKQAFILTLLVVGGLLLLPLGERLLKKKISTNVYYTTWASLYICSVLYFTLLCRSYRAVVHFRFIPFQTYKIALSCWLGIKSYSKAVCHSVLRSSRNIFEVTKNSPIEDNLLNITLFLPFGFLAGYLFKKTALWKILASATALSTVIEIIQAVFHLGSCSIDDVLNNTLGTLLGWLLYKTERACFARFHLNDEK